MKEQRLRTILSFCLWLALPLALLAQPANQTTRYDEQWGMSQWHITKMLQDHKGFMWLSTWNGLARFDGYEFVNFKTRAGDGCTATNDRIRDIFLAPGDNIYCLFDEVWYLFDRLTGRFSVVDKHTAARLGKLHQKDSFKVKASAKHADGVKRQMHDRQGNLWQLTDQALVKQAHYDSPCQPFPLQQNAQARCFMKDRSNNYWITTKAPNTVMLFGADNRLKGYLTPQGTLSASYTTFSSAVYCMCRLADGTLLLGTKPDGIYMLTPRNGGSGYNICHMKMPDGEKANAVYDIRQDRSGRVWIATFDGIFCLPSQGKTFIHIKQSATWRVRYLHISTDGKALMAATTTGIAIAPMPTPGKEAATRFTLHQREPDRKESLNNSATMDICETPGGRIFVSTESGGVNEFESIHRFDSEIRFKHHDQSTGFNSDVALSLTLWGNKLLVVGNNVISTLDLKSGEVRNYGMAFFRQAHQYSDAHPILLPDGSWLFGMQDGAFTLSPEKLSNAGYVPALELTAIQVERNDRNLCVDQLKEVTLNSRQRTLTVNFAALDLRAPENIQYAFRLHPDDEWTLIGTTHSLTLPDMKPGDYTLQLRSTNADGIWVGNVRELKVHVTPRFTETIWAQAGGFVLLLAIILGGIYAVVTIRQTRRKQRETLAAYLALLDRYPATGSEEQSNLPIAPEEEAPQQPVNEDDERLKVQIMQFVEENMGNSDAGLEEMASAVAMSRSGLNRKMKKLTGLSPVEFLREARIKHACRLLRQTTRPVSEVAYACGFTDPKYFGRTFKQMTGMSPSDYRSNG